jgi:hypothetical protein
LLKKTEFFLLIGVYLADITEKSCYVVGRCMTATPEKNEKKFGGIEKNILESKLMQDPSETGVSGDK